MADTRVDVLAEYGFLPGLTAPRQQDFIAACKSGLVEVVRAYLDLGMPVDVQREISFEPALIAAAEGGSIPVVELLLERGAALEQRDRAGDTAFRTAINWKHLELARWLAARGADVDAPNAYDESALEHVIGEDEEASMAIDLLLELGADPAFVSKSRSPMRTAIVAGKAEVVKKLLAAGASPSCITGELHRATALHDAAQHGQLVELLLAQGADPTVRDAYGLTPLDYALERGHEPLVAGLGTPSEPQRARARLWQAVAEERYDEALAILEREDLPVEIRSLEHRTLLIALAAGGHFEGVKRLLARGASPAPAGTQTAVSAAIGAGCVEVLDHLLAIRAPIFDSDGQLGGMGNAVWEGHVEVIRRVLPACSPEERKRFAEHVQAAVMREHTAILELLVEHGVPVDEQDTLGDRPLAAAVSSYYSAPVVEILLRGGASVRATDKGGDTPLHELLSHYEWDEQRIPVLRELLRRGAPLDAVNWQTRTPFDVAGEDAKLVLQKLVADEVIDAGIAANELARTATWAHLQIFYAAGHRDFMLAMIDAGVAMEPPVGSEGVLDDAITAEDLSTVRALIARGANVNHESSFGATPLETAASKGNYELVRMLLDAGAALEQRNHFGWPVVHAATRHLEILQLLADRGARFDQRVCSPLFGAVGADNLPAVELLLQHGAYPDSVIPSGATPLSYAIEKGFDAIALRLIAAGASPTKPFRETGDTPLTAATKQNRVAIAKALLAAGADPADADRDGNTALALMTQRKQLRESFAELLLAHGVDVSVPKVERLPADLVTVTPAWFAVYSGNVEEINKALESGTLGANERDPWGLTPLMAAVQLRSESAVRVLLQAGARHDLEDLAGTRAWDYGGLFQRDEAIDELLQAAGETLSMDRLNAQAARSMVYDELKQHLDRGELSKVAMMIRQRRCHPLMSIGARSLVHEAIERADEDLLGVLIDLGISLDQEDLLGVSPLALALQRDRVDLAEKLVAGGADPEQAGVLQGAISIYTSEEPFLWLLERTRDLRQPDRHGYLPIHMAARHDRAELVERLLDRDPTLRDVPSSRFDGGRTPLRFAVWYEAPNVVELLLERGADPNEYDQQGTTLLHHAIGEPLRPRIAQLLIAHGASLDFVAPVPGATSPRFHLAESGLDESWLEREEQDDDFLLTEGEERAGADDLEDDDLN